MADEYLLILLSIVCEFSIFFLEMLFDLNEFNICRYIKHLESMLVDLKKISKNRVLSQSDLETIRCYGNSDSEIKEKPEGILFWEGKTSYGEIWNHEHHKRKNSISNDYSGQVHDFKIQKYPIIFWNMAKFWLILDVKDCKNSIRKCFCRTKDDEKVLYPRNKNLKIAHLHRNEQVSNTYSLNSKNQNLGSIYQNSCKNYALGSI